MPPLFRLKHWSVQSYTLEHIYFYFRSGYGLWLKDSFQHLKAQNCVIHPGHSSSQSQIPELSPSFAIDQTFGP